MDTDKAGPFNAIGVPHRTMHTHHFFVIGACVACLVAIFICIFTPLILFQNMDVGYTSQMSMLERRSAASFASTLSGSIVSGYAVGHAMEGYITSRMRVLPNMSLPPLERIRDQNFTDFPQVARALFENSTSITLSLLAPGGVYTETYPVENWTYGRDIFQSVGFLQMFLPTPQQSVLDGHVVYLGPFYSNVTSAHKYWALVVRRPVYNRTSVDTTGWASFWGFTETVMNISAILQQKKFNMGTGRRGRMYGNIDYILSTRDSRTGELQVITTSLSRPSRDTTKACMATGTSVSVIPGHSFTVTVCGADCGPWLSASNVTIVVSTVVGGCFLCLGAALAVLHCCTRAYDGATHAPKITPFAMLTVGPCRGEELWDLASDQMVEVTERLGRVLTRQMRRHHAYQIQQVHPLTTSYVTRGAAAALQMAFDTIEELHRHPIDDPLRRLLGDDDGRLLLAYAVHWCTDAVVRLDSLDGVYRYEGPDVVFGGRMWAFAAPSAVTASEAVAQVLPRFGMHDVVAQPYRRLHVVRARAACGTTGDCDLGGAHGGGTVGAEPTIYIPFSAPTPVEATVGMWRDTAPYAPALSTWSKRGGDDACLRPQTLFTLLDVHRPALVAASAAAPDLLTASPHPQNAVPPAAVVSATSNAVALLHGETESDAVRRGSSTPRVAGNDGADGDTLSPSEARSSSSLQTGDYTAAALSTPIPLSLLRGADGSGFTTPLLARSPHAIQGDGVTRALLRPVIPHALDVALHVAFDYQAITLGMHYDAVRVLVYYFYMSYTILFRPLAAPERHNIYRRLVTAFGVPQQGILEHLAARCAIRCMQHSAKLRQWEAQKRQQ